MAVCPDQLPSTPQAHTPSPYTAGRSNQLLAAAGLVRLLQVAEESRAHLQTWREQLRTPLLVALLAASSDSSLADVK